MAAVNDRQAATHPTTDARLEPGFGDQMLSYLVLINDAMTSTGAQATAQRLTVRDLAHAIAACRYFGLDELAAALVDLPTAILGDGPANTLHIRYRQVVPDTRHLTDAARAKRRDAPQDFQQPRAPDR